MAKILLPLPPLDERQRYTIDETIRYLRSSRRSVYIDIKQGRLATIKEGARRYVPGIEILRRSSIPPAAPAQAEA